MSETYGCDFSGTKPDPKALKDNGYSYVLGYISRSSWKNLTKDNINAYRAAGLAVGLVFEDRANRALSGNAGGSADGAFAESYANDVGYPNDCPIFYAVDYAAPAGDIPVLAEYGKAFNYATNRPVGPYGSYSVLEALVTPGAQPNQVGWQTAAWSNGLLSAKANVYQRSYHKHPLVVPANQFDEDVICQPIKLFGGVLNPGGGDPIPTPAPIPTPPPPPVPHPLIHIVKPGENLTIIARNNGVSVAQLVAWNHLANPNLIYPNEHLIVGWR